MSKRALIAGESWMTYSVHVKGFDSFTTSTYEEGVEFLQNALEQGGYEVEFLPNHIADRSFPTAISELEDYDVLILSDIGANTLLLHPDTFVKSVATTNRLDLIAQYVRNGGGLVMVGGYLSFQGIEGKANYKDSPIEDVLPVTLYKGDDRVEKPSGVIAKLVSPEHPCVDGVEDNWPALLGYNRLKPRENATIIAEHEGDPILAVREVGEGRTAIFASDCGPHWAPPDFVQWDGYNLLWQGITDWLAGIIK